MGDQQTGTDASPPSEPPVIPLWPWGVAKIKRKIQQWESERQKENAQDRLARRTTRATVVIAGAAIVTVVISVLQYRTFQGQLDVMQGQLAEMKAEQRPYIYLDGKGFLTGVFTTNNASRGWIQPVFVNGGNGGTRKLQFSLSCTFSTRQLSEPWDISRGIRENKIHPPNANQYIGPHAKLPGPTCEDFTPERVQANNMNALFTYLCGYARYRDRDEGSPWFITEFCYDLTNTDLVRNGTTGELEFKTNTRTIGQHNCSDEDCPDYKDWQ